MANYCATARSSYFGVKDAKAFKKDMERFPDIEIVEVDEGFAVLELLDFYFLSRVRGLEKNGHSIYEVLYAKNLAKSETTMGRVLENNRVSFWSRESCNHRYVVSLGDILLNLGDLKNEI